MPINSKTQKAKNVLCNSLKVKRLYNSLSAIFWHLKCRRLVFMKWTPSQETSVTKILPIIITHNGFFLRILQGRIAVVSRGLSVTLVECNYHFRNKKDDLGKQRR